jgi:hypothetical protein
MSSRVVLLFALAALLGSNTTWAKKKHHAADGGFTIEEISPASVTMDIGKEGQETYTITSDTKATLDGAPVSVDDLKAGMVATLTMAADGKTVLDIAAKDAPRVTKKPVVHHTDDVWIMH